MRNTNRKCSSKTRWFWVHYPCSRGRMTGGSNNIFGGSKTLSTLLSTKFGAEFSIIFSFNDLGKGMTLFYELTWTQGQDSPVLGTTVWSLGPQTSQMNDFCHPLRRLVIWHQQVLLGVWKYVVCNVQKSYVTNPPPKKKGKNFKRKYSK